MTDRPMIYCEGSRTVPIAEPGREVGVCPVCRVLRPVHDGVVDVHGPVPNDEERKG